MINTDLEYLVKLYQQTSQDLDKLKEGYRNTTIHLNMLQKIEELMKKDSASKPTDIENRRFLSFIYDRIWAIENSEIQDKNRDAEIKINSYDERLQITYLEKKLIVIKEMLGEDAIKKIEAYETESILKLEKVI